MATAADVRRIALSLVGTIEVPHMDRAAFRVARIYCTLPPDGKTANLMFSPEEQELRCQHAPAVFAPVAGGWGRMGYTTVALAACDLDLLTDALRTAWSLAQPKKRPAKPHPTKKR